MEEPSKEDIAELKKTWKGKYKLWKMGTEKFKKDPPIYRIHMMQGLMVKLTMYMIVFAAIYAVSVGFWVFALIILPVGTIGNYYSMKNHFIKYKQMVKQYEMAGMIPPIEEDISNLRKRWRIIESQLGFLGVDFIYLLFLGVLAVAYFGPFELYQTIILVFAHLPVLVFIYFGLIGEICKWRYYQ